jgi:hypothetical protein
MRWLGSDMPPEVIDVEVEDVFQTTTHIGRLIDDLRHGSTLLATNIQQPAREDIMATWNKVVDLVTQCDALIEASAWRDDRLMIQDRAETFLTQLRSRNSDWLEAVEHSMVISSETSTNQEFDTLIRDPTVNRLGLADQLRLRRIISSPSSSTNHNCQDEGHGAVAEYKTYTPGRDQSDIEEMTARVSNLATLLNASKSSLFRSLRCSHWTYEPASNRFVYHFNIPDAYRPNEFFTLQSIIKVAKGSARPILNQRFKIAFLLAKAVQKWHDVGWVHQGISSPHILFFKFQETKEIDYNSPFLGGFDLARPNTSASLGRYVEDVAFNVYRHPARQGPSREGHRKIHDYYSLGVILLELGLWQSAYDIVASKRETRLEVDSMHRALQRASNERLPHYAGEGFMRAVTTCINNQFGVTLDDRVRISAC